MGVTADWICIFEVFDPYTEGNFVYVHEGSKTEDDFIGRVASMLVYGLRFRRHVETRWLSMGSSARALLVSCLCGLLPLLNHAVQVGCLEKSIATDLVTDLQHESLIRYLVVTALVAHPLESFTVELMRDARVALRRDELLDLWDEEQDWLTQLSPGVWNRFVDRCLPHDLGADLADQVLKALSRAHGHLQYRIFNVTSKYPWSLCKGDVRHNIHELCALSSPPSCEVASKMWLLSRSGSLPLSTLGSLFKMPIAWECCLLKFPWICVKSQSCFIQHDLGHAHEETSLGLSGPELGSKKVSVFTVGLICLQ